VGVSVGVSCIHICINVYTYEYMYTYIHIYIATERGCILTLCGCERAVCTYMYYRAPLQKRPIILRRHTQPPTKTASPLSSDVYSTLPHSHQVSDDNGEAVFVGAS